MFHENAPRSSISRANPEAPTTMKLGDESILAGMARILSSCFTPLGILLAIILCLLTSSIQQYVSRRRMPPGPRPLPLIGNLHQIPKEYPWRGFAELFKKHGPL